MPDARTEDALDLVGRRWLGGRVSSVELAWAAASLVLLAVGLDEIAEGRWHSPWPVSVLVLVLGVVPLVFLPTRPVAAGVLAAAAWVTECLVFTTPQSLVVLFAIVGAAGGMGRYAPRRRLPVVLLVSVAVAAAAVLRDPTDDNRWDYLFTLAFFLAGGTVGVVLGNRQAALARAVDESVRLRTEQGLAVERALTDERARIARDLHDVVAHAVSLMVVQSVAGRTVAPRDPERAVGVFDTIEATGQRALGDLRRLLGVLRTTEQDDAQPPGLAAVQDLVAQANAAGLPCRLRWTGDTDDLPDGVDVAAFRVVQESLTNALKHGARTAVDIAVTRSEAGVRVDVLDRATGSAAPLPGASRGLRGMRERVGMYDGTLAAGPQPEGWRVEAFFPVAAT